MANIQKINKLINSISSLKTEGYKRLLETLDFSVADFKSYINFSKSKYIRTCIAKADDFELILLCWEKGQKAHIHGHDGNEGWVYVLQGVFQEKRYDYINNSELKLKHSIDLHEKQLCYTSKNKEEFHSIENINQGPSISLHLYKKPIEKCKIYCHETNKMLEKQLKYDFENKTIFI